MKKVLAYIFAFASLCCFIWAFSAPVMNEYPKTAGQMSDIASNFTLRAFLAVILLGFANHFKESGVTEPINDEITKTNLLEEKVSNKEEPSQKSRTILGKIILYVGFTCAAFAMFLTISNPRNVSRETTVDLASENILLPSILGGIAALFIFGSSYFSKSVDNNND